MTESTGEISHAELVDQVKDLHRWRDGISNWKDWVSDEIETIIEENEQLRAENEELREQLDRIEKTAEQALSVASKGHDPDEMTQTEMAKRVTRDEICRRAAVSAFGKDRKLTIAEAQDLVDRDYGKKPAWAVVNRAFNQLKEDWPEISETSKDGCKALRVDKKKITNEFVAMCETSLERDDLTKRFGGGERVGGVE